MGTSERHRLYTRASFKPGSDKTFEGSDAGARAQAIEGSRSLLWAIHRYLAKHEAGPPR